ncbi:hypothetical protein BTN82_06795 [Pseudomonas chlororaphis]|uniref:POTRA domain-containing protein n=1 Tax=Pseudomonas chlororaphis TaxID=587753 RepID=A0A1Q8EV69_9PSED|nr:ShlB/FhaC/HecB family hemolysin secretion/activation protein [Pseudomonas chlororaphis]OLF55691.1 hypothetical protein BTN82_06795 [Pseudomonas chlororaphis]
MALAALLPLTALAQVQVPNAGQAIRNIEAVQPTTPVPSDVDLDLPKAESASPPPSAPDTSGIRVQVSDFVIVGNQVFSVEQLRPLLADLQGQELDLNGLRGAAQRLTDYYQKQGYVLARAFLPPQDIDNGVVRIEVMEGRYGNIEVQNSSRALDKVIAAPLSALRNGEAVRDASLERSLLLLSDLPGVQAKGTLRPGQERGTTDLVVDAEPGPLVSGTLEADNFGGFYTGEYRLGGSLNLNNPLRLGDQLSLRVLSSDKTQRYYRAAYQLPVGPWSTRVGASYSKMSYRLGKRFEVLDAHGLASIRSFFVSQPLVRSRVFDLNLQLQYDDKRLRDDIDFYSDSNRKQIDLWTLGLSGNGQDHLLGGGRSFFDLSYASGRLHFGDRGYEAGDRRTAGTAGGFSKLTFNVARVQRLSDRFQLYTQLNTQWAPSNLDSSEKLGLGGPYGVRGYPLGNGSGDQGWQASAELRYALAPRWQLSAFVDKGEVKFNKLPWTPERNTQRLSAAGVGATWVGPSQQVSLTTAWPLSGQDKNDESQHSPRFWINATQYF